MGKALVDRMVCYDHFFANGPDHPDGPACCKEDGRVQIFVLKKKTF